MPAIHWRRFVAPLALALAGCAATPDAPPAPPASACAAHGPAQACTSEGLVQGSVEQGLRVFKGLPYAAAPVGSGRWRAPLPPQPWAGVRDATRFSAICPQLAGTDVVGDEDCLTLNIWAPAEPAAQPRPVMVFLTGGGNHSFSGQGAGVFGGVTYDGRQLAPQGVVFVSFNYRLGALGFLAHPGFDAEHPQHVSGNYGSQDQVAMLRWVQRNIAAFGGDPQRVMLFGTSAGGGNICALMTAPSAAGLFQRAAMHSSVPTGCELPTLADAEQGTGRTVAQRLGCDGPDAAACLRAKPMAEVVRALPGSFGVLPRLYGPVVDGQVFPEQPIARIARGAHAAMPVIVGNASAETMQFVLGLGPVDDAAAYEAALQRVFRPETVPRILAAYPPAAYPTPRLALVRLTTDAFFTCSSRRVARVLARQQSEPVYRDLFDHALANDAELRAQGATHTVEHPFFFAWGGRYVPTDAELALQRRMVADWSGLAATGRVGDSWPTVQPGDAFLRLRDDAVTTEQGDSGAHCDFWDTVALPQPHL